MTIIATGKATDFVEFTRASNATVTDSDGKVKGAPHNLLTNSESFDAAAWAKTTLTVAANADVAPNSTTTADTLTAGGANSTILQTFTAEAVAYTYGVWLRRKTGTGTVQIAADSGTWNTVTITSSWALYTISQTPTAGSKTAGIRIVTSADEVYAWGAHLYRSDLAMQPNTSAYPMYNPTTPKNLLGYTESLTTGWTNSNTTDAIVSEVNPVGLTGAVEVAATAGNGTLLGSLSLLASPYTFSIWLKRKTGLGDVQLTVDGTTYATVAVTNTWTRFSTTLTPTAGTKTPGIRLVTSGDAVYAWGAQLSDSASLDSYSPVYAAAVTSAAYYGPRRDFDPVTLACKGLLVEEQRTNFFLNSNAPTAGAGITITAAAAVSPDGSTNAYRIAKTDATDPRYFSRSTSMTTVAGRTYTVSAWFKYDGFNTTVSLEYNSAANWDLAWNAQFTVASTGVTTLSAAGCTQSVQNVGNGWYRTIVTFTAGAAPTVTSNPVVLTRVTGASGVTVLGYGGQIEENASFATSYIPTGAATATRNADVASVSTQAFPYSSTDGTWVANFQTVYSGTAAATVYLLNLDGSASKRVLYLGSGSDVMASYDGTTIVSSTGDVTGSISKSASAYSSTERAVVSNGGTVATGAIAAGYATASTAYLGSIGSLSGTGPLCGHIRQITYLPRRISNTELQTRTA